MQLLLPLVLRSWLLVFSTFLLLSFWPFANNIFLEMYRELTARGWRSKLEEQWLMERLAEQAEEQARMRAALEACNRDGIPADGLCDEEMLAFGRQYERGEREQASARNTHLSQPATPPAFPFVPSPPWPGTDSESRAEAPPVERKPVHGMSEEALFDLAERIAAECPALAPCLFAGRAEDGGYYPHSMSRLDRRSRPELPRRLA